MPVIHQKPWSPNATRHPNLLQRLATELRAANEFGQPLVLVRTFPHSELLGVTVVWDAWDGVDELDRASVILKAYEDVFGVPERDRVAVPVGYTEPEAVDAGMLPYAVRPLLRKSDPTELWDACRSAMVAFGASDLWKKGAPRLRLPTRDMAERYVAWLTERVAGSDGIWGIEFPISEIYPSA